MEAPDTINFGSFEYGESRRIRELGWPGVIDKSIYQSLFVRANFFLGYFVF